MRMCVIVYCLSKEIQQQLRQLNGAYLQKIMRVGVKKY